ncbi:glutathione binding-like protein [Pseudoalteromonas sp. CNC9-20]|uniref:glutathione binding-like protein n=1 Tax=Pseudoalteromonas sp. CNC9-20 TaxID=2917750 RepID=UPI001EF45953|nr:glutathione binding-like protein [Pseudoalteromonas sp. CNC9-20]MCG7571498.1 glutathione binding-like protein [Pseudoalteromonas sp. CNC9-20]
MKLYYKPGACSMASHIILNELEVDFKLERVDTDKGQTETGGNYSEINSKGYVPALAVDNQRILTENPAILEYLADLKPQLALAPSIGTWQRYQLREQLAYLSSELHKSFSPFFSGAELTATQRQAAQAKIGKRLAPIEAQLSAGSLYLQGDTFSVADAYAFVIINWSQFIGFPLTSWPAINAYWQRVNARASVRKAMHTEGLVSEQVTS